MWPLPLFMLTTVTAIVGTSKILFIPDPCVSHMNLFTILGEALKDDGHEVWMISNDKNNKTISDRGIVPLTYAWKRENDLFTELDELSAGGVDLEQAWALLETDPWKMATSRICEAIMQNSVIMSTIRRQKFDLVVVDGADELVCHLMIPYIFDIPFVPVMCFQASTWGHGTTGMPSIEPEIFTAFSNRMDFWQRLENAKAWFKKYYNAYYQMHAFHMDKYCPKNKPKISMKKLVGMAEMYFLNYEVLCLDYPRVSGPNLQFLGATTGKPVKPLPRDLEAYVAGAEHGVVLISFGSKQASHQVWNVIGEKMFDALGRLPQRAIVQYRLDGMTGTIPDNVKLLQWLPQNDILGHRRLKLFITHGGNNGQNEAVYHGVPMLVIPLFIDQYYNAMRVEQHTYGKQVSDVTTITSDELYQMMKELIINKTYARNIKKCSEIIRSMPPATEKFVFWVNHVLRFGGAHLRPPSLDMPLYQVLMLDVLAYYIIFYLVVFHVMMFSLYFLVKYTWTYFKLCRKEKNA
ncbi:2-hydroxyacylsphingosine 1-beta-galactosyltransferase-like [Lineus longissimus]|uniref:2-hydroxyacylsphingosine 1-beta-galactosyltransferase-like n=1 Tax=Lineus longissimus TaxID=88925 RepID=UPI00315DCCC9